MHFDPKDEIFKLYKRQKNSIKRGSTFYRNVNQKDLYIYQNNFNQWVIGKLRCFSGGCYSIAQEQEYNSNNIEPWINVWPKFVVLPYPETRATLMVSGLENTGRYMLKVNLTIQRHEIVISFSIYCYNLVNLEWNLQNCYKF